MISKSDIVILVAASSALAMGIYRWHMNTQDVGAITIQASSRVVSETTTGGSAVPSPVNIDAASLNASLPAQTNNQNQVRVQTIAQPEPVTEIVVNSTPVPTESISLGSHEVQYGDYLGKIAQQYGTDVRTLRELNDIDGSFIRVGEQIFYPL